jgi:ABC-type molybdate transport system substrate-binding protein
MKFLLFLVLIGALYYLAKQALGQSKSMSVGDAAKLLAIAPDADAESIVAAHKRLIAKVHPDTGGSAALAAQVNQARDILLRRITG